MDKQAVETVLANNSATALRDLGPGSKPFIALPNGYSAVHVEEFMPKPVRTKRKVSVTDEASFIEYFNRFALPNSAIFMRESGTSIHGAIDYDHKDGAEWCEHIVNYDCPLSKEWKAWTRNDSEKMNQAQFAEFIENHLKDFASPNGAAMLELATKFSVVRTATFGSAIRLSSGEMQFNFSEENNAKGTVEVPEKFTIGIAPFKNGQPYSVDVRLRYRLNSGTLSLWYEMIDADKILDDAFQAIAENIKKSVPEGTLIINGTI